jgi:hypothetical protein
MPTCYVPTLLVCLRRYKDNTAGNVIVFFDFSDPSAINVKRAFEGSVDWPSLICKQKSET